MNDEAQVDPEATTAPIDGYPSAEGEAHILEVRKLGWGIFPGDGNLTGYDPSKAEAQKAAAELAQKRANELGRTAEVRIFDHKGRLTATRYFEPEEA